MIWLNDVKRSKKPIVKCEDIVCRINAMRPTENNNQMGISDRNVVSREVRNRMMHGRFDEQFKAEDILHKTLKGNLLA